jgi:hypothetical protein
MHDAQCVMEGSECCKIPKTNRDFWVAKISRNKERDKEEQRRLAEMGWHCITVWECELRPSRREETLESLAFTLNHIYLQDHSVCKPYEVQEDTIYGVDFKGDIAKAVQAQDYRMAVRLVYLQTLWHLQNAELINWQPSKTPVEYMRQVNKSDFTAMSQHFIRVRYGNFEATQALFEEMLSLQLSVTQQLTPATHD